MLEPLAGVAAYILKRPLARVDRDLTAPALFAPRTGEIAGRWRFAGPTLFSRARRVDRRHANPMHASGDASLRRTSAWHVQRSSRCAS
jgi:hypothetical protein